MITLETERLLIRPFRESDAEDVFAYATDPEIGPSAGWKPHESPEESLEIVRMFIREQDVWVIVLKELGRVIGSIGLHRDGKRRFTNCRSIGYVLAKPFWGRGFATEATQAMLRHAFEDLAVELVSIVHYPFNTRSKRVIEKCRFRYEGTLRQASQIYSGEVNDDVCYSMTREEYYALQGGK